jgi:hypothetical protein
MDRRMVSDGDDDDDVDGDKDKKDDGSIYLPAK